MLVKFDKTGTLVLIGLSADVWTDGFNVTWCQRSLSICVVAYVEMKNYVKKTEWELLNECRQHLHITVRQEGAAAHSPRIDRIGRFCQQFSVFFFLFSCRINVDVWGGQTPDTCMYQCLADARVFFPFLHPQQRGQFSCTFIHYFLLHRHSDPFIISSCVRVADKT